MKKLFFFLSFLTLLASCSDSASDDAPVIPTATPISFSVTDPSSRAYAGSINDITALASAGFGVYASYTGNNDYSPTLLPDLFFNQTVTWSNTNDSTSHWVYTPVKYWPNEANHKASFFAYAPYETIAPAIADPTSSSFATTDTVGIVGVSSNSHRGDPFVDYKVATDSAQASVDLMWGTGSLMNLSRNDSTQTVSFRFRHALARLGITISMEGKSAPTDTTSGSIVLVDSIVMTGNFPVRGRLCLNNPTSRSPRWENLTYASGDTASTIIINHRSITRSLRDVVYDDVKGTELWRHNIEQGGVYFVSRYLLKAFRGENETQGATNRAYFMFIPNGEETRLNVSVTYTIHNYSATGDNPVTRTVHATESLGTLEAGQTYTLHLNLPNT